MANSPNIKAKYILKGPRKETVTLRLYSIGEFGMESKEVTEERMCWMLYLPHGKGYNSIRITSKEQLEALNLNRDIPLVDMETGEVVGSLPHMAKMDYGPDADLDLTEDDAKPKRTKVLEGA